MKKQVLGFAIGARCPIRLEEGGTLQFSQAGITMFVSIPKPDQFERKAMKSGHPVKFSVAKFGRLGFLVSDFGDSFTMDMPFDVGLESEKDIPDLILSSSESKILLTIVAVDQSTNKVFGLRVMSLPPSVSSDLSNLVQMQRSSKTSRLEYESNLRNAYTAYPTVESLMESAADLRITGKTYWPTEWGTPEVLPCAQEMLQCNGVSLDTFLQRIIAGDSGRSDSGDGAMGSLRNAGLRFTATFEMPDKTLLYISVNAFGRTFVSDGIIANKLQFMFAWRDAAWSRYCAARNECEDARARQGAAFIELGEKARIAWAGDRSAPPLEALSLTFDSAQTAVYNAQKELASAEVDLTASGVAIDTLIRRCAYASLLN